MQKICSILLLFISSYFFINSSYAWIRHYVPLQDSYLDMDMEQAKKEKSQEKNKIKINHQQINTGAYYSGGSGDGQAFSGIDNNFESFASDSGSNSNSFLGGFNNFSTSDFIKKAKSNPLDMLADVFETAFSSLDIDSCFPGFNEAPNINDLDANTRNAIQGLETLKNIYSPKKQ